MASDPDFGPHVAVFDPSSKDANDKIQAIFKQQEKAQFGLGRFAILFKPGHYNVEVPVGFFTHVAGLGKLPGDVLIEGRVWTDAGWMGHNATCNFWRIAENLTVKPTHKGANVWAVSQAAPLRRVHIQGDLHLSAGGWSSGGFMADCRIDGTVHAGSQQQWFSRNCDWKKWDGGAWNMVFAGCTNPPDGTWPQKPYTTVSTTRTVQEKPFVVFDDGRWSVMVPQPRLKETVGTSWEADAASAQIIPIEMFYIAKPETDNVATINAAIQSGKHLLLTPGIYPLNESIVISRPGTIVLGLGLPTLTPTKSLPALRIDASEGTVVSGLMIDAGSENVATLVQIGIPDDPRGSADHPAVLHDLYCRVGGNGPGKASCMVTIYDHHVIGDNLWLWRADHGKNVGWLENTCANGLIVEGDDVTMYGLFVEHAQAYQTIWNGNRGRVFFYQSEMPYDPPSAQAWRADLTGYASYKVGDNVLQHETWGMGVYHVFKDAPVVANMAVESPDRPGIKLNHLMTYTLSGGKPGSGIRYVVSEEVGEAVTSSRTIVVRYPATTSP